jgi:hypothetical protein
MADELQLLKNLEDMQSEEIPLLQGNESGLFSDEEIEQARRRKQWKMCAKYTVIASGVFLLLFIALQGIYYNFNFARKPKFEYQIENFRVDETNTDGAKFSLDGSIKAQLPWSFDFKNMKIELLNEADNVLASVDVGNLKLISGKFSQVSLNKQRVEIVDAAGLSKLLNYASRKQTLPVNLKITTDARPHWLPFTFQGKSIKKRLQLDLKSKLPSEKPIKVEIKDLKLEEAENESVIATVQVRLENPLPIGMARVPKLSFKIYDYSSSVFLGNVQLSKEFLLKPKQPLSLPIRAILAPAQNDAISNLVANYLAGRPNRLRLRGDSKDSSKLPWINALIGALDLQITVPGRMFEESIKKIDIKSLQFHLDAEKPESISLQSDAHVSYHIPRMASAFRPQVERIAMKGSVVDQRGRFLATLDVPEHPVQLDPKVRNSFSTALSMEIPVDPRGAANIDDLLAEMFWTEEAAIAIQGTSWLKTKMVLGSLSLPRIPFSTTVSLPGFGGVWSRNQPIISDLQITKVDDQGYQTEAKVSLHNPNAITSHLGTMHFEMFTDEAGRIGAAWLEDALIVPGANSMTARLEFTLPGFRALLPGFLAGLRQEVVWKGVRGSAAVHPVLKNVMGSMIFRGILSSTGKTSFLQEIHLKREAFHVLPKIFTTVNNPLPFPVKIYEIMQLKVFAIKKDGERMKLISEMESVPLAEPLLIPANVQNWTDDQHPLPLQTDGNFWHALEALKLLISEGGSDSIPLRLEGRIRVSLQEFEMEFEFIKDRVPLYLK